MSISPVQAILIGLTYYLANTAFFGGLAYFTTWRPLVNGLLVGLILGDPLQGALIGAAINLLYLGYMSVGGTLGIGDAALAGILGSAVGIAQRSEGLGILTGVALASLGYQLLIWRMKGDSVIARWIDAAAARGDVGRMQLLHIVAAQAWLFVLTVPAASLLAFLTPLLLATVLPMLPDSLITGLALGGRLTVALGIALALKFVFNGWNIALFFAGAIATVLGAPFELLVGIGAIATLVGTLAVRTPNSTPSASLGTQNSEVGTFLLWQFFSHSNYSFERLQGSGLACALAPALKDNPDALKRHGGFFNTEVNFGTMIPAILLRMEQRKADPAEIDKTRQTLMGTIAGFGDELTQGAFLPALLAAAIGLTLSPWFGVYAIGLYVIAVGAVMLAIAWTCFRAGLIHERQAATRLLASTRIKTAADWARRFTALALGALTVNPRVLAPPLPGALDVPAAGAMLAVLLTLACHVLLTRANLKPTWLFIGIVVVGLGAGLTLA